MGQWLTDVSIARGKEAAKESYQHRWRSGDGFSNGDANSQIPKARFVELTGLWVAFDGSPYRKPRISKERRKRLDRMKAENLARLKELMKLPGFDRINRPGKRG